MMTMMTATKMLIATMMLKKKIVIRIKPLRLLLITMKSMTSMMRIIMK